jgi:hypothetical protein
MDLQDFLLAAGFRQVSLSRTGVGHFQMGATSSDLAEVEGRFDRSGLPSDLRMGSALPLLLLNIWGSAL